MWPLHPTVYAYVYSIPFGPTPFSSLGLNAERDNKIALVQQCCLRVRIDIESIEWIIGFFLYAYYKRVVVVVVVGRSSYPIYTHISEHITYYINIGIRCARAVKEINLYARAWKKIKGATSNNARESLLSIYITTLYTHTSRICSYCVCGADNIYIIYATAGPRILYNVYLNVRSFGNGTHMENLAISSAMTSTYTIIYRLKSRVSRGGFRARRSGASIIYIIYIHTIHYRDTSIIS